MSYVVTGRSPRASSLCDWNMLAGVVSSDDEADGIEYRIFLLNRSEYRINDTWNATGLCGTGSNDVWVEDTFVAEKMTVAVSELTGGPTPGSMVNPNALYALPVFSLFPYVLSGVGLGNAQACLNDYVEFARHRASTYNRAKLSDLQTTQIKIAEASAKIDAARLVMRTNCIDAMDDARRGYIPDLADKTTTSAGWRVFGEALHRSGLAVVRGKRCAQPVHVRRAAAAIPRRPRGEFAPRIQFRCGRNQLWTRGAWPAVRKSDALRPGGCLTHPNIRPIRPMNLPATTRRSIPGTSAMHLARSPQASPSSRRWRRMEGRMA